VHAACLLEPNSPVESVRFWNLISAVQLVLCAPPKSRLCACGLNYGMKPSPLSPVIRLERVGQTVMHRVGANPASSMSIFDSTCPRSSVPTGRLATLPQIDCEGRLTEMLVACAASTTTVSAFNKSTSNRRTSLRSGMLTNGPLAKRSLHERMTRVAEQNRSR
jgi:hypothetical protein